LRDFGCWGDSQEPTTSGGLTQGRQRLRHEPMAEPFAQVAVPAADKDLVIIQIPEPN
jgi:hypothetical protein